MQSTQPLDHVGSCKGGNTIPLDEEGRAYHFGCKAGEVANQILITTDYALAEDIAKLFDKPETTFKRVSNRGYLTFTGEFKGKRISVVAFGIGFAMIDFLVRELCTINQGPVTFIQLGSAPTPKDFPLGTPIVLNDACAYEIDYENFTPENPCPYRFFTKPVPADEKVLKAIENGLNEHNIKFEIGRVVSNPSYCAGICAPTKASGGIGPLDFKSEGLYDKVKEQCGDFASLEMETYPLFWTAHRSADHRVFSAAVSIAGSNLKGEVLPYPELHNKFLEIAPILMEQLGKLQ